MMDCRNPEETIIRFYDENNKLSQIYVEHMNMVDLYNWKSLGSDLNLPSKKIINKDACVLFLGEKKLLFVGWKEMSQTQKKHFYKRISWLLVD